MIMDSVALAGSCLQAGDWPGAEHACRQVLAVDPSIGDAWFMLGVASQILGKIEESVGCYRNAVQLVPSNAEAWNNLGASYSSLRRPEEAEPCIRQALRLAPDYAQAHNNLGNALSAQGKHEEAMDCYRRALALQARLSRGLRPSRAGAPCPGHGWTRRWIATAGRCGWHPITPWRT